MMKVKRILSSILVISMILSMVSFATYAENTYVLGGADFDANSGVVYDGTAYYESLVSALSAVHGNDNAVLYCKPGADVGTMTHGHVCKNLTVYGNGAYISGGEQDFEIDMYKCPGIGPEGSSLTGDVTLVVDNLTGSGAWGTRHSDYTVNYVFTNCKDMGKVYFTGITGENNINLENCTFTGNNVSSCKVYSNAAGTITLTNVDFSNIDQPVALNNKSTGVQNIVLEDCDFADCGAATQDWTVPVSIKSSVAGGKSVATVENCTFSGTVMNSIGQDADVLLDYGVGEATVSMINTEAKLGIETEKNVASYTEVDSDEIIVGENNSTEAKSAVATLNGNYYASVQAAIDAAVAGDNEIVLLPGTIDESVVVVQTEGKNITIKGQDGVTYTGSIHISGNNRSYTSGAQETLTIENISFEKTEATASQDFITSTRKEVIGQTLVWGYPHNVTVRNCSFTGNFDGGDVYEEEFDVVAIRNVGGYNWTIENCTATGVHSFLQASANTLSSRIDNVTVTGSKSGLNLGTNANYTIANSTFNVLEYALRVDANSDRDVALNISECDITAAEPFIIRKAQGSFDYTFNISESSIITTDSTKEPITRTDAVSTDTITVSADANYWGGNEPTFTTIDVGMDTYYKDEDMTQLVYTSAYEAYIVAADGTETPFATFKEAMAAVASGETIKLNQNIELEKAVSFTKDIEFTLDGNGYTISPAAGSTEANSAFNMGQGNDSTRATRKYNFTNIVFDGWTTDHVIRLQGTTSNITDCKFINTNQPDGLGIVTLTFADAVISNCVFKDNVAVKAIDFNSWGDKSASSTVVKDCVFENNTFSGPGVILYNDGAALTVKDNDFISNTVSTSGNAATVYMGFNDGITVTGNLFKNNTVTSTHASSVRIAGGVFAGGGSNSPVITENVFEGNVATSTGYPVGLATGIAYSAYYQPANLDGNYWDGEEPTLGVHYSHEYSDENKLTVEEYYGSYETDADGNLVFGDERPVIAKSVALQYILDEASCEEGVLVYDIAVTTADDYVINRLNSADFTFALTQENGKNIYEIIDIADDNITVNKVYNPADGSVIDGRYEFHFDHKNNVTNDTAHAITIAKVKFTGYGKFSFGVVDGAGTNAVHATTIVNNIVTDFTAGNGLTVNTDIDKTDDYVGVIGTEIKVSKRDLTINVSYPNSIEENAYTYQQMKVTVTGPENYNKVVYLGNGDSVAENGDCLSLKNGGYSIVIADELTLNSPYTVTVEGEGYRTVKYTVNMTEDKELNFWNNVKDNDVYVEEGKITGTKKYAQKVTFLAGDIVKDDEINIYDLSAVVSYFGEIDLDKDNKPQYAKYDLNRDGKIDSKDVAYVLVSWGN